MKYGNCNNAYICGSYQFVKFRLVIPGTERISSRPTRKKPKIDEQSAPIIITLSENNTMHASN